MPPAPAYLFEECDPAHGRGLPPFKPEASAQSPFTVTANGGPVAIRRLSPTVVPNVMIVKPGHDPNARLSVLVPEGDGYRLAGYATQAQALHCICLAQNLMTEGDRRVMEGVCFASATCPPGWRNALSANTSRRMMETDRNLPEAARYILNFWRCTCRTDFNVYKELWCRRGQAVKFYSSCRCMRTHKNQLYMRKRRILAQREIAPNLRRLLKMLARSEKAAAKGIVKTSD